MNKKFKSLQDQLDERVKASKDLQQQQIYIESRQNLLDERLSQLSKDLKWTTNNAYDSFFYYPRNFGAEFFNFQKQTFGAALNIQRPEFGAALNSLGLDFGTALINQRLEFVERELRSWFL